MQAFRHAAVVMSLVRAKAVVLPFAVVFVSKVGVGFNMLKSMLDALIIMVPLFSTKETASNVMVPPKLMAVEFDPSETVTVLAASLLIAIEAELLIIALVTPETLRT